MDKLEKKIEKYVEDNPCADFHKYLEKQLKNKQFKKLYLQEKVKSDIALEIFKLRKSKKLTQAQLANNIKVPQANIARIEQGHHLPTLKTLSKILNSLGEVACIKIGQKSICL